MTAFTLRSRKKLSGWRHPRRVVLLALILVLVSLMLYYQRQQQLHDHQPKPATDEEKEAGQSQIQLSHVSAMNRYPDEYSAVQQHFLEKKSIT